ncbi:MAG: DUF86 domain-containing protein [Acidobacteria bacterium]|nr:DUF86 domain-containing protein [Acidobacteriota bacterium]
MAKGSAQESGFERGCDCVLRVPNNKTKAAVERKLQILTEAIIRLEPDSPETAPDIDWKAYRGIGNFMRTYHRVSDEIVWNTVEDDLPLLKKIVERAREPPRERDANNE